MSCPEISVEDAATSFAPHGTLTTFTREFEELCGAQCKLLAHALDSHLQAAFYARTPDSWRTGFLKMQRVPHENNLPSGSISLAAEYERELLGLQVTPDSATKDFKSVPAHVRNPHDSLNVLTGAHAQPEAAKWVCCTRALELQRLSHACGWAAGA